MRQNYVHAWFYYDNVKHCAVNLNYIKNLFQNNRSKREFVSFMEEESKPYFHKFNRSQSNRLPVDCITSFHEETSS